MKVIRTIEEMRQAHKGKVGFVPTMGALHDGHLSLFRTSRSENDVSIISIFVNPSQFGPSEDFSKYPRPEIDDLAKAEACGVDIAFLPGVNEMYGKGATSIDVGPIGTIWEGSVRPGHFSGVATVVAKLLHIVDPDTAYFGQKDFQQCAVISQVVRDLNMLVNLSFLPTIREADGLAMSSRNAYLSDSERALAPKIYQSLIQIKDQFSNRSLNGPSITAAIEAETQNLRQLGFEVDYFELVDEHTLTRVETFENGGRLIVAVRLGRTRLIDNIRCSVA